MILCPTCTETRQARAISGAASPYLLLPFRWHLSRLKIEPVTDEISCHAIDLLREAADDMGELCGKQVRIVAL